MNKLLILALTLVLASVAVSQLVIPSGWGSCGNYWARKCARFCLATGRNMNYCWVDRAWWRAGAVVGAGLSHANYVASTPYAAARYPYVGYVGASPYVNRWPNWNNAYVGGAYPYRYRRFGVGAYPYRYRRYGVGAYPYGYRRYGVGAYPYGFRRRGYGRVGAYYSRPYGRVGGYRRRAYGRVGAGVYARRNVGVARGLRRRAFLQTEVKQFARIWRFAKHVNCNCI
jgi:hypothetical protein